jgi:cytochrome c553
MIADAAPGTLDALSLSSPILVLEQKRGETMRRAIPLLVLTLMAAAAVQAQFDWAYQSTDEVLPQRDLEADEQAPRTVPGSKLARTQAEIDDPWSPPDWFPGDHHAPVPEIVARGAGENVRACAQCHGFAGSGHPESSHLTGLTVNYIVRQMAEFKTGARKDRFWMNRFAPFVTDVQVLAAAEWYAGIEPRDFIDRVIETETVPVTYIGDGRMRFIHPDGGTEPIGNRVLEVPQDRALATARHPYSGFTVYAPPGSVARGADLATTGANGTTIPCAICHGEGLKGLADVPRLAGISPLYAVRQLDQFRTNERVGSMAALMTATVANLSDEDIVALAAYLASLDP